MSKKPQREIVVVKLSDDDQLLKKKALETWDRARLELVQWRPFLGAMAMQLQIIPVVDFRCRTASTDGRRVFCDAEFILEQSEEDSLFILAHEVLHCALMHFTRERGKIEEHQMWNFAIDHEVNAVLQEDGLTVPKDAVLYRQHLESNAEQVYDLLLTGRLEMLGELMDDHEMEGNCKADGKCDSCSGDKDGERDGGDGPIEIKMDPDYNPRRSDAVWREWASKMANAARISKERGDTSAALQRVLDNLYPSNIDWRTVLKRWTTPYIGGARTWLPPNRRYVHQGIYLPSRRGCKIEMVAAIDTSGSVWEHGVFEFLSELQAILSSFGEYEITVLQIDTQVNDVQVFDFSNPFNPTTFQICGGGGTSFVPAFEHVEEYMHNDIRGLIYMTDGYGFCPERQPPYPVLWALTEDGRKPTDWGEVVKLKPTPVNAH